MTLCVDLRHRLGTFDLDVAFESSGRLTALFGPSGSGKTSLVNLIGGLMRPDKGRIVADGRVFVDTSARSFLPKHRRRIGYVFQDARLFPHMSVSQNLRYGRFFTPAAERYAEMDAIVELLGIGHLLDRRPAALSGGEKQRVAIGRALIASPRLILMDEPLASLDEARKAEILPYVERLRDEAGVPIVYVSHSVAEVARLATDIVVLASGKVTAAGPTSDIVQRLDLLPEEERGEGGAVLDMQVVSHDAAFGMTLLASAAGEIRVPALAVPEGRMVRLLVRARDVMIATEKPRGFSALNILAGNIVSVEPSNGVLADVRMDCHGQTIVARITRQSVHDLGLAAGKPVFAVVKSVTFDRSGVAPRRLHS
ncbi:molybdenum ABC transporter ATP-binding protein [Mesorhizobium sp. L-8-3]|uniref:molybdenum ABC transporter ATP-binding protein n=1 Tax=Mesorhizobium sp. L-8-3 TaxID=2744522 RepID=UPI001928F2F5|nr:molybdenum ABC transporter ATP-binding protein [Mesorhizobium sp. L-8-3]BCH26388.1 molybdenum import ATP-binding protein ModC [Mesorhizobium sp. L-8-3]